MNVPWNVLAWFMAQALAPTIGVLMILAGLYLACLGAAWLRHRWLKARAIIKITDAERDRDALAHAVTCTLCRKNGTGHCTCEIDCSHSVCTGDRPTIRTTWTAQELAILRGEKELPL